MSAPTAASVVTALKAAANETDAAFLQRYFKTGPGQYGEGDVFLGVRMGTVFAIAKANLGMPVAELERLLESELHEARACALSIMNEEAKRTKTPEPRRTELFELYLRRHDRINNWDLVDVACRYVVGVYLFEKPRDVLYRLARSKNMWERRTSIVSCWWFIRAGQVDDALAIATILLSDTEDIVQKAVGWMLRYAGDVDRPALLAFLAEHAATMPRTTLRYAIEKLPKPERAHYLALGKR